MRTPLFILTALALALAGCTGTSTGVRSPCFGPEVTRGFGGGDDCDFRPL